MNELNMQDCFDRAYQLASEINMLQESMKELKTEFSFDKEFNVNGFPKKDVAKTVKAAIAKAKQDDLKGKADELNELSEIQEKYSK